MLDKTELHAATLNLPGPESWGRLAQAIYPKGVPPEELAGFIPRCVDAALTIIELLAEGVWLDLRAGGRIAITIDSEPMPRAQASPAAVPETEAPAKPKTKSKSKANGHAPPLGGPDLKILLTQPINALGIPPRSIRALTAPHIKHRAVTIHDLVLLSEGNLLSVRGIGEGGIDAIKAALTKRGLHLAMSESEIKARIATPIVAEAHAG